MNKIAITFLLTATGLILFLICLIKWKTKQGELFGGILLLYSGSIILIRSIAKKDETVYGLKLRGILTGGIGIIAGLVLIVTYLSQAHQ